MFLLYLFILIVFFILLLLGLPVGFSLAIVGTGIMLTQISPEMAFLQVPQVAFNATNNFLLVALPAFILTGQVILHSGIGVRLFDAADKWLRQIPAGIGIATVVVCAFFASVSGSSVATVLTVGAVASAEMIRRGYPRKLAYGSLAGAGTLGILIPPSGPQILYGAMTDQSIGELFMAGVVPGILLTLLFILYILIFYARKLPGQSPASWNERWKTLRDILWVFLLPLIIIGGIYSGIFTPTEAASVSFVVSLILGLIIYRSIKVKNLLPIFMDSASSSGMILFIMVGALLFGHGLSIVKLPQTLEAFVADLDINRWLVFIVIILIWLILGMFLEVVSILLITIPIFFPIVEALGFDPIWFGILAIINMEMAIITPPVGMNLFVMMQIAEKQGYKMQILEISRAAFPYILIIILEMIILSFVPELVTWFPSIMRN